MCFREASQGQRYFAVLQMHPTGSMVQQTEDQEKAACIKGLWSFCDKYFYNCCQYDFLWAEGKEANTSQLHPSGTREASSRYIFNVF